MNWMTRVATGVWGLGLVAGLFFTVNEVDAQAPPPTFTIEGNELKLPSPIAFETGTDKLRPESEAALNHIKDYLNAKSYITLLRIEGHTDAEGDDAKNLSLSQARASAVAKALVAKGVDCKRLIAVGFGETKPIAANDSAENRAKNRRITVVNAMLRGIPIGGMPIDGGGMVAADPCN